MSVPVGGGAEAALGAVRARLARARRVAALTGAGVSAASGLPTFRGALGFWREHRAEDLATPQAYARDPLLVWEWYAARFHAAAAAAPNGAHLHLARLEAQLPDFTLVTQNVDGLHARSGSRRVLELHGNLTKSRCERCGHLDALAPGFALPPCCSRCGSRARPNVVWFGEHLPERAFEAAAAAFSRAEVALVIGTSGVVEPAASLGRLAAQRGAVVVEINPEPTPLTPYATLSLRQDAVSGLHALLGPLTPPPG
ncbi:SIR2 family NAD-dependent protein deacylase [Truepera radiovictrix]|uniref:NAD-dependent protein deacylase n=1 Tax=Truepera radiovictrix (strain DSM 17093 / CIP 108686 / LMG 22925 / RQ-24) TaxID=649638 RepID=D7CVL4_TRURR|nr:Silent information regulator protein Sir2 [Truepera radiovictrix DSM 17093]